LHQLSIDLKEMENELFEIKTKHKITVSIMEEYTEEWLRKKLVKITETDQLEIVTMVIPPPAQQKPSSNKGFLSKQVKGLKISIAVCPVATFYFPFHLSSLIICDFSFSIPNNL
jgi:hypothetical protein